MMITPDMVEAAKQGFIAGLIIGTEFILLFIAWAIKSYFEG